MRERWKKFLTALRRPRGWVLALTYFLTALFIAGALFILTIDYTGTALEIVAYCLFGLAAITLAYSVYTFVLFTPVLKRKIVAWAEKYEFTHNLLRNYGFRTVVFTIGSFAVSVAYGLFNGILGILSRSVWYGALAMYYILLAFIRGGVLVYQKRNKKGVYENAEQKQIRTYRTCGILLLILNVALSSAIAQMIFDNRTFAYNFSIYAAAAYAFYKITMSIINLVKARRQDDLTLQAVRDINLADALVSILALQTALLQTFSEEGVNVSLFNTLTGTVISLFAVGLSIYMIVNGTKKLKKAKEKEYGKQE